MIEIKLNGSLFRTVYGLTQWDYGRYLKFVSKPALADGTQVHFYQGSLATIVTVTDGSCRVPDKMLENAMDILAYVYIKQETMGETILTVVFKVHKRPKPEDYVYPDHDGSSGDYDLLSNKPSINGTELKGNKTIEDLGEHTLTNSELDSIVSYQYNLIFGGN